MFFFMVICTYMEHATYMFFELLFNASVLDAREYRPVNVVLSKCFEFRAFAINILPFQGQRNDIIITYEHYNADLNNDNAQKYN